MNLKLIRKTFTDVSTIGELYLSDVRECFVLEDYDRELHQEMPLAIIEHIKFQNETAIPYGKYEVIIDLSNRFKRLMPLLLDVPGFSGIRIHAGNTEADTDGCLLLGQISGHDFVGHSVAAYNEFFPKLKTALEHERCFIEITKEAQA